MGSIEVTPAIETRHLINGKFVSSSDGNTFDLLSPTTVCEATVDDVNAAVDAAKAAFPSWSTLAPSDRGKILARMATLIEENHDELARLEALSMGRPVSSYFDPIAAASFFRHYSEAAYPQGSSSLNTPGFVNMVLRQPVGVAAAIIPWNVPVIFFGQKLAPALAVGCTVLLKSSEKAPLTSLKLAQLAVEAGFPPGVINILSGHGAVSGNAIASHMDIRVVSFTGSTRTGRAIQKAAADSNLKNVVFELGGKSPSLIFADADLEAAVTDTTEGIMFNSGQACMANSRIYVEESIADAFITKFAELVKQRKIGDPLDKNTTQGPQADKIQHETVLSYIKLGKESGGQLITGGSIPSDLPYPNGRFVEPTVFANQPEDARVMKEEIFGPVVTINTFKTEAEAIHKANDTEFGLYASVYTKNLDRALRVSKAIDSGTVAINCTSPTMMSDLPYGGYKASGTGRESYITSMDHYLETKSVLIKVSEKSKL